MKCQSTDRVPLVLDLCVHWHKNVILEEQNPSKHKIIDSQSFLEILKYQIDLGWNEYLIKKVILMSSFNAHLNIIYVIEWS